MTLKIKQIVCTCYANVANSVPDDCKCYTSIHVLTDGLESADLSTVRKNRKTATGTIFSSDNFPTILNCYQDNVYLQKEIKENIRGKFSSRLPEKTQGRDYRNKKPKENRRQTDIMIMIRKSKQENYEKKNCNGEKIR